MRNYFNDVDFEIIGSTEIFYSYYNLCRKVIISNTDLFEYLKNIKERIKYLYSNNSIHIKLMKELFNDFDELYIYTLEIKKE